MTLSDWQPEQYLCFKDERTQPTVDLARRIETAAPGRILDVGCGPGNSTAVLEALWPEAAIIGMDSSESMLEKARNVSERITWTRHDAARDMSAFGLFDIVFSNAALQWIPDTETLIPRLYGMLNPGGTLAVQAPYVRELPVYAAIQEFIARPGWSGYFAEPVVFPLHHPFRFYYNILCTLEGTLALWQTEYIHVMENSRGIVEWYKGTGLRPFLNRLPDEETRERFLEEYGRLIQEAYPSERDGKVLLPFNRVFFLLKKGNGGKGAQAARGGA